MDRIRKILVATDYSEDARRAEMRAAMLSIELKAETLELMTVDCTKIDLRAPAATPEKSVACAGDSVALPGWPEDGPACVRSIRAGSAPQAIVGRAMESRAGLIVVAARGKRFFADLFRRHNNDELIRLADRPVLLVCSEPNDAYKRVLVAIDFSEESKEAARAALAVAPSAHFTFLHVFRVPDEDMMRETGVSLDRIHGYRIRARDAARIKLNAFIDSLGPKKQLISRSIQHGVPAPVIGAQAKQLNADLIALGKHGKPRFVEFLLGSVTRRVVDQGWCDLLVTTAMEPEGIDLPPAA
ncbi:universal stress protein [Noviherbaspirillum sp. ST9]|uniref:universal stress protein n=1 Tax=Noviherbaspirillum sp. ST9 TaxID=3401606 RepID=UPI003B58A689